MMSIVKATATGFAIALAAGLVASPAFAQFIPTFFKARVELTCKDDEGGSSKLQTYQLENREWIALCNGLDPDDPGDRDAIDDAEDAQRVVFDHVDHRLLVIDACSQETVCSWHFAPDHDEACARVSTGTPSNGTRTSACAYPLEDLRDAQGQSIANIHGEIYCKQKETLAGSTNPTRAVTNCDGALGLFDGLNVHDFGDPCRVEVATPGPRYTVPASCEP
jgi:hypothetical protein